MTACDPWQASEKDPRMCSLARANPSTPGWGRLPWTLHRSEGPPAQSQGLRHRNTAGNPESQY